MCNDTELIEDFRWLVSNMKVLDPFLYEQFLFRVVSDYIGEVKHRSEKDILDEFFRVVSCSDLEQIYDNFYIQLEYSAYVRINKLIDELDIDRLYELAKLLYIKVIWKCPGQFFGYGYDTLESITDHANEIAEKKLMELRRLCNTLYCIRHFLKVEFYKYRGCYDPFEFIG